MEKEGESGFKESLVMKQQLTGTLRIYFMYIFNELGIRVRWWTDSNWIHSCQRIVCRSSFWTAPSTGSVSRCGGHVRGQASWPPTYRWPRREETKQKRQPNAVGSSAAALTACLCSVWQLMTYGHFGAASIFTTVNWSLHHSHIDRRTHKFPPSVQDFVWNQQERHQF